MVGGGDLSSATSNNPVGSGSGGVSSAPNDIDGEDPPGGRSVPNMGSDLWGDGKLQRPVKRLVDFFLYCGGSSAAVIFLKGIFIGPILELPLFCMSLFIGPMCTARASIMLVL